MWERVRSSNCQAAGCSTASDATLQLPELPHHQVSKSRGGKSPGPELSLLSCTIPHSRAPSRPRVIVCRCTSRAKRNKTGKKEKEKGVLAVLVESAKKDQALFHFYTFSCLSTGNPKVKALQQWKSTQQSSGRSAGNAQLTAFPLAAAYAAWVPSAVTRHPWPELSFILSSD